MTEDEAKTKTCVQTLAPTHDSLGGVVYGPAACIASACMAWRALTRREMRHRDGHVVQPGEAYLRGNVTEHQVPDGGCCGLAGMPQ